MEKSKELPAGLLAKIVLGYLTENEANEIIRLGLYTEEDELKNITNALSSFEEFEKCIFKDN